MSSPSEPRTYARSNPSELRTYVRRKGLNVDLNALPSIEDNASDATDQQHQEMPQTNNQEAQRAELPPPPPIRPVMIDVDEIDDDIAVVSPRIFAQAKKKARRNPNNWEARRPNAEEELTRLRLSLNSYMCRRDPPNQTIIDCDRYVSRKDNNSEKNKSVNKTLKPAENVPPPLVEPPPTFSCPVCMGPLVDEMSTKCGHIFCKQCIGAAIKAQGKCPTCRRKIANKDTIRVYLPSTN